VSAADQIRGHAFLPTSAVLRDLPNLYSTENVSCEGKLIHLHFFVGSCDWYLAELDHTDLTLAFGYVNLGDPQCAEWGYFDLEELANLTVTHRTGFQLVVERDLHWTPRPFDQIGAIQ
jgi:hypothetical protein